MYSKTKRKRISARKKSQNVFSKIIGTPANIVKESLQYIIAIFMATVAVLQLITVNKQTDIMDKQKDISFQQTEFLKYQVEIMREQEKNANIFQDEQNTYLDKQIQEIQRQNLLSIDPTVNIYFDIEGHSKKYKLVIENNGPVIVKDLNVHINYVTYDLAEKTAFSGEDLSILYRESVKYREKLSCVIKYSNINRIWEIHKYRLNELFDKEIQNIYALLFKISYRHALSYKEYRVKKYLLLSEIIYNNKDTVAMAYDPESFVTMDSNPYKIALFNQIKEIEEKRIWNKKSHFNDEYWLKNIR